MISTKDNPFTLMFGKEPTQRISRASQMESMLEDFRSDVPSSQICMITGIRGAGKTVFMTEMAKELSADKDWIVAELNSSQDILTELAAVLTAENSLAQIFQRAKINLSFFGLGLEVTGSVPITSIQTALTKMLESLKKHGKKVLICVDEVVPNDYVRVFAGAFQIFVRQDLPVFLLMTGLYENIHNLQNENNLTFLYRAPKLELKPLNITTIAEKYQSVFSLEAEQALKMAKLTKGYPFAFQVLGYYTYRHGGSYQDALPEYRQYLEDYVYEKVWSEMSRGDRRFAYGIAESKTGKAKDIKEILGLSDREYSPYRDRILKRGIINGSEHGYVSFTLPLFEDYVLRCFEE